MFTKTQEKILCYLFAHGDEPHTIRALSREIGVSYPLCYNNVQELLQRKVLTIKAVPPAHIVGLHPHIPREAFIAIEAKRRSDFIKKHRWAVLFQSDIINYTRDFFYITLIFGSYAKGKETKHSDLDILIVVSSPEKVASFEKAAQHNYTRVKKHCIVLTVDDFIAMLDKGEQFNVGNEARKHHILLYGAEEYYEILEKVRRG